MSEWIKWKWTAEKPYPETLDTKVLVKFGNGYEVKYAVDTVGFYFGDGAKDGSNWHEECDMDSRILEYRVIE